MHEGDRILARTRHLEFVERGRWSFVRRVNASGVVLVVAVTDDDEILFIEQIRIPVGGPVIELPAGLAGDIAGAADEPFEDAARRELLEETGYRAGRLRRAMTVVSSAGMSDERTTIMIADELVREHGGGGVEGERITVHRVPRAGAMRWLRDRAAAGLAVDARVLAGLLLLELEPRS